MARRLPTAQQRGPTARVKTADCVSVAIGPGARAVWMCAQTVCGVLCCMPMQSAGCVCALRHPESTG
eukprot:3629160-Alexandrium_andersonii.AAC.1